MPSLLFTRVHTLCTWTQHICLILSLARAPRVYQLSLLLMSHSFVCVQMCQGKPVDVGGYYKFDRTKADIALRPSPTFNRILEEIA